MLYDYTPRESPDKTGHPFKRISRFSPVSSNEGCPVLSRFIGTQFFVPATARQSYNEPRVFLSSRQSVFSLATSHLAIVAIGVGLLNMLVREPELLGIAILGMATAIAYTQFSKIRHWKAWSQALLLGTATILATAWLNYFSPPANAAFFAEAENYFTTNFNLSGTAITIVFATLRGLYILYLAIAFIGVFNAVRQDEDWVIVARTPILVVIVVTLADILTQMIVT